MNELRDAVQRPDHKADRVDDQLGSMFGLARLNRDNPKFSEIESRLAIVESKRVGGSDSIVVGPVRFPANGTAVLRNQLSGLI